MAPVRRVEAECCMAQVAACFQRQAGTFVPDVQFQSCCVLGVTKLPNCEVQMTLAGAAIRSKDVCCVSRTADFGSETVF